ncbi:MAG: hypothetical protein V7L00_04785 [Nostoc sp.]|uniref:hypothetical protein n=1 Tax=Nostoc sp. TaxID=1180 RepID=UPI002FFC7E1E
MKQYPERRFTAKELAQETGLPEQTANNAFTLGNICRDNSGFYYPNNGAAQGETVKDPKNDDLKQKIEKKIQELETQIALNMKQIESFKSILNQ